MNKKISPEQQKFKDDIELLKKKILNVEEQINEEEKIKLKLRSQAEDKIQILSQIDEAIATEIQGFRTKKLKMISDMNREKENKLEKIRLMGDEINRLNIELSGIGVIEAENTKLHERIKEESIRYGNQMKLWRDEIERTKIKNFDSRVKMEDVFRNTLKNFNKDSKIDAINMMEKEAINAEMENKALQKELKSNASLCKKLIGKHKLHSEKLSKLKLVKEVSETGESMQKKQILDVKKTKETLQSECEKVKEDYLSLENEVKELNNKFEFKSKLLGELEYKYNMLNAQAAKLTNCKNKVLDLISRLLKMSIQVLEEKRKIKNDELVS